MGQELHYIRDQRDSYNYRKQTKLKEEGTYQIKGVTNKTRD